jgi:hypothetical protein
VVKEPRSSEPRMGDPGRRENGRGTHPRLTLSLQGEYGERYV